VRDQTLLPDGPASSRQTYTLINAGIGYAWRWSGRRMSVDLMGKNLRDEKYRPSQSTRGRPREFQLTYVARF
jgi:iron complex outermembrane receptor protein